MVNEILDGDMYTVIIYCCTNIIWTVINQYNRACVKKPPKTDYISSKYVEIKDQKEKKRIDL